MSNEPIIQPPITIVNVNEGDNSTRESAPLIPQVNILMERQPSTESRIFNQPFENNILHPSMDNIRNPADSILLNQPLFQPVEERADLDSNQLLECFNHFPGVDTGEYRFNLFTKELGSVTGLTFADLKLDIPELINSECFWLDIHLPQHEELHSLEKALDIHMLTVEDILTGNTREKCEVFPNYYYVVVKGYIDDEDTSTIKPLPMHLLVFQKCIITVNYRLISFISMKIITLIVF